MRWHRRLSGADLRGQRITAVLGGVLLGLLALRLVVAARLPLTPDEAYYWTWSRHLQAGYLDHPPMVAVWIWLGTNLVGQTALGVRLLGPVSAFLGSLLLWDAARTIASRGGSAPSRGGVRAVCLLNATVMIGVGALTMTPDTPLVFFVSAFLWSTARYLATDRARWLLVAGLALGLSFESKYTGALIGLAFGGWVVTSRQVWRHWLAVVGAAALAFIVIMPLLWWNATHGWASFLKQGGRIGHWEPQRALQFMGELLGGQIGLATPLIFILFIMGTVAVTRESRRSSISRLLAWTIVLPGAVFLQHSLGARVQANWLAVLYPSFTLAAVLTGRRIVAACAVGGLFVAAIYVQALFNILPLRAHYDVVARQTRGWDTLAKAMRGSLPRGTPIYADDYAVLSELAFYGPGLTLNGVEKRWSLAGFPHLPATAGVFLIRAGGHLPQVPQGWRRGGALGQFCRYATACFDAYAFTPMEGSASHAIRLPSRSFTAP